MTDRVQPGAIDSIIRNDEIAQVFGQFSEGWVVKSSSQPTPAAVRRPEIDETALNGFSQVSTSGFDITIDPGEGFVGGWCARDVKTTISVPANTTSTVVLAWSLDAVFDPATNQNRDLADKVRVDLAQNVDSQYPSTELFDVDADATGITTTTDRRRLGPTVTTDVIEATDSIIDPEGNLVTDLSSPVRVTDEAVTFSESDVTVTSSKVSVESGSLGLGTAENIVDTGGQAAKAALGDVTGNGQDDIIFSPGSNQDVKFFDAADNTITNTGEDAFFIATGDVDGDGKQEILFVDTNKNLKFHDVTTSSTTDTGEQADGVASGDIDADGTDEIIFIDGSTLKFRNVANSTTTNTGISVREFDAGDVTGDGRADLIFTDPNTDSVKFRDVANSTTTNTGIDAFAIDTGDVTGDGRADIVTTDTNNNIKYRDVRNSVTVNTGLDSGGSLVVGDLSPNSGVEIITSTAGNDIKFYDDADGSITDLGLTGTDVFAGDVNGSGGENVVFITPQTDDLKFRELPDATSASTLVEFDNGAPADIDSYDLATFQRTLDGETVTVDIEDGNGNVLFSDINPDVDISDVDVSKNVTFRVSLSRNNTANDPTIDYLARRFTR